MVVVCVCVCVCQGGRGQGRKGKAERKTRKYKYGLMDIPMLKISEIFRKKEKNSLNNYC